MTLRMLIATTCAVFLIPHAPGLGQAPSPPPNELLPTPTAELLKSDAPFEAFVGSWEATAEASKSLPKIVIRANGDSLEFQFWTTASGDVFGPAKRLEILTPHSKQEPDSDKNAFAFGTFDGTGGNAHFFMKRIEDRLHVDTVKIGKSSDTSRLIIQSIYRKSDGTENGKESENDEDERSDKGSKPVAGYLAGRIDTGSTLRGTLKILPQPEQVEPINGVEIQSARPTFRFTKVPSGQYTLEFDGTIDGVRKKLRWKELKAVKDETGQQNTILLKDASPD